MMNKSGSIFKMFDVFNIYCIKEKIEENIIYLLYLLEDNINCIRYDYHIKHTLSKELLRSFNNILD